MQRPATRIEADSHPSDDDRSFRAVVFAILDQAKLRPTALALASDGLRLSYHQLDEATARLAAHLRRRGVQPGDRVGSCFADRLRQIVSMIAIWRAGAVLIPLDSTHPPALVAFELRDAQPKLVICDTLAEPLLRGPDTDLLDVEQCEEQWMREAPLIEQLELQASAPALILFTSGTTGHPKGVRITHGNVAHLVYSACHAYGFCATDTFCTVARPTFSISLFEVCSPLAVGATLRAIPREQIFDMAVLVRLLEEITVLHAGPSLLTRLFRHLRESVEAPRSFPALRHVSTGGDIVLPAVMEEMKTVFDNAELYVIYGCTETCCMSAAYEVPRGERVTKSFVGFPCPRVGLQLLTEDGESAPVGKEGEICFSGPGIVQGYLNRPEVEVQRFIALDGVRYYRTGDQGRLDERGRLEFLGRTDFQVQVRGMRVELVGIENAVRELGLADDCAATLRTVAENDDRLILFVQNPTAAPLEIRRALSEQFPDYMIPQHVVPIAALPLTANGKLDRRALHSVSLTENSEHMRVVFDTVLEARVAQAMAKALGIQRVDPTVSFFDLGGHSLLAVEAAQTIRGGIGMEVTPTMLFQAPTARQLAQLVSKEHATLLRPIRLNASASERSLFLFMGVHSYRELARALVEHYSVFGVFIEQELAYLEPGSKALLVSELARRYLELVKRQQPHGPYTIGGHSFGGVIAYEAAQQLLRAGERVEHLLLIDAMVPEVGWQAFAGKLKRLFFQPRVQKAWLKNRVRLAHQRLRGESSAVFSQHEPGRLGDMEVRRMNAYLSVQQEYVAKMTPLRVPATLIVAGQRLVEVPLAEPDGGWTRLIPGIRLHAIDTQHRELLEPPWAKQVADTFASSAAGLDRGQRRRSEP